MMFTTIKSNTHTHESAGICKVESNCGVPGIGVHYDRVCSVW